MMSDWRMKEAINKWSVLAPKIVSPEIHIVMSIVLLISFMNLQNEKNTKNEQSSLRLMVIILNSLIRKRCYQVDGVKMKFLFGGENCD